MIILDTMMKFKNTDYLFFFLIGNTDYLISITSFSFHKSR